MTAKDVGWFDWGRCAYPPQGMPSVWVHAGGTSGHARTVRISGWMKLNGCGYEQFPAGLYRRVIEHGRSHWERVATTTTGKRGSLSFCVSVDRPTTFRVMTAGADGLAPAWSNTQFVETPGHH